MTVLIAGIVAWVAWHEAGTDLPTAGLLGVLAALAWSLFAAVFWPFTSCPVIGCDKGKLRRPGKRSTWRKCSWCKGSGVRLRWARRVWDETRPAKHRR